MNDTETPIYRQPTDVLLREVSADVMNVIAREAKRQRRSRSEQISVIIEQAATRIERAEQRRLAAQTQEQATK